MSCFSCCKSDVETGLFTKSPATFSKVRKSTFKSVLGAAISVKTGSSRQKYITAEIQKHGTAINDVKVFSYEELAAATDNFNPDCLVGEGGFGCVYRGYIPSLNQAVAVKQLERKRRQGTTEFFTEIMLLSLVNHPNIVKLIGYCAEEDQRILVYEFMSNGSLESQLLDLAPDKEPLDWRTRMKIAEGAARGLEYLHDIADPPVIYRDFKTSNILLDENYNPKLSDFGLAKLGPTEGNDHITTTVMGTYGYCSPEYALTGQLTTKSDVYSFGVVFLEIITGRRAIDNNRVTEEQNLINWAQPLFKDREKFSLMADPLIKEELPVKSLFKALAVAAMCLQEEADTRPLMGDVVTSLEHLSVPTFGEEYAKAESIRSAGHIESFRVSSSRSRADQQL